MIEWELTLGQHALIDIEDWPKIEPIARQAYNNARQEHNYVSVNEPIPV